MFPAIYEDPILAVPGPSQLIPAARSALTRHFGHRSELFRKIFRETIELLKRVFDTSGEVHILTASGTGAVEAAVFNFISPDDKVLALVFGTFGRRFKEQASRICKNVLELRVPYGEVPTLDLVKKFVEENKIDHVDVVITVFNETNPGTRLVNLPELVKYFHSLGAIVIVDNVSGLGGDYFSCDQWDIDVALSSTQKCIGAPPGLSFIAIRSQEAYRKLERASCMSTYFDLKLSRKFLERNETPFTPAVNVLYALHEALNFIVNNVGLERWIKWHRKRAELLYTCLEKLNFTPFVRDRNIRSVTVLSFNYPQNVEPQKFRKMLYEKFNVEIADGMDELKGKIFRLGNMGWLTRQHVLLLVSSIVATVRYLNPDIVFERVNEVLAEITSYDLLV